jgi:hypothetical protein
VRGAAICCGIWQYHDRSGCIYSAIYNSLIYRLLRILFGKSMV